MKKILSIFILVSLVLSLLGCSNDALEIRNAIKKQSTVKDLEMKSKIQLKANLPSEVISEEGALILALLESGLIIEGKVSNAEELSLLASVVADQQLREMGFWNSDKTPGIEFTLKNDKYFVKTTADEKYLMVDLKEVASYNDGEEGVAEYEKGKQMQKRINDLTLKMLPDYLDKYDFDLKKVSNLGYKTVNTPEGSFYAKQIKVELTEEDIKNLLVYTLDNLANSPVAKKYILSLHAIMKEYDQQEFESMSDIEMYEEFKAGMLAAKAALEEASIEELKKELGLEFDLSYIYSIDQNGYIRQNQMVLKTTITDPTNPTEVVTVELTGEDTYWNYNKPNDIAVPSEDKTINILSILEDEELINQWDESSLMYLLVSSIMDVVHESKMVLLTLNEKTAYVNGEIIEMEAAPFVKNGRTMVPVRVVAEGLGAELNWNQKTKEITFKQKKQTVVMTIGSDIAYINGKAVKLDQKAEIVKGRTTVPLRFVTEGLGANVEWVPETKELWIRN